MILKRFIPAFILSVMIAFPQNMIGCAGGDDPYDYYVSFFWNNQSEQQGYKPFYYTGEIRWYDLEETPTTEEVNTTEWKNYFSNQPSDKDVYQFVYKYSSKDLNALYYNIEKSKPFAAADSVKKNSVTNWFLQKKDLEALGYILYAKQVEPQVSYDWDAWEPVKKDTAKMGKLIKNGLQLYTAAKNENIKLRYAYQLVRLAHYADRYDESIRYYDTYVKPNTTSSYLKAVSLAQKGGAVFKNGDKPQAAYLFSQSFAQAPVKRLSNMLSFSWCFDAKADRNDYIKLCKTKEEKANMLGMFALGSIEDESKTMEEIAAADPSSPMLEIIAAREINKAEENYLTPSLRKNQGASISYYYYDDDSASAEEKYRSKKIVTQNLLKSLEALGNNRQLKNSGFYTMAAGYTAYMLNDITKADELLSKAKTQSLTSKQTDEWNLIKLLVSINQQKTIDEAFEEKLLPQLKWLEEKALIKRGPLGQWHEDEQWKKFYRDVCREVLAEKYKAQGNTAKQALCYGLADNIYSTFDYENQTASLDFLRDEMTTDNLLSLFNLFSSKSKTGFENYMTSKSAIKNDDVTDVIATSYIRDFNFAKAEEWLKKAKNTTEMKDDWYDYTAEKENHTNVNPLHDYINDWQRFERPLTKPYTKLTLVQKIMELQKITNTEKNKETLAKAWYQLGTIYYNMSYYGNSWMAVSYYRSSTDWFDETKKGWEKEFFGVFKAKDCYQKAYELSANKEFKAAAFFLVAKCAQRQIVEPEYDYNGNYDAYDKKMQSFQYLFYHNKLFPQFQKEFGSTAFFQRAVNTCSYLRDFVKKK